jgi:hypothetical protein
MLALGGARSLALTQCDFGDFSVHTREELGLGRKVSGYPANHLLDGGTRTAWVFKGL